MGFLYFFNVTGPVHLDKVLITRSEIWV